jgi:hypothetical protein
VTSLYPCRDGRHCVSESRSESDGGDGVGVASGNRDGGGPGDELSRYHVVEERRGSGGGVLREEAEKVDEKATDGTSVRLDGGTGTCAGGRSAVGTGGGWSDGCRPRERRGDE